MEKNELNRITEKRNPKSMDLDKMSTEEILKIMNQEDKNVVKAVREEISCIREAIDLIVEKMKNGGRLFYIGAGTSGRIGVLDAVECKPTFSIAPGKVIGILAGGNEAMFESQENLEDKEQLGAERIKKENINENDSIVGITASGETPFVLGALKEAKKYNTLRIGLTSAEDSSLETVSELTITPIVGPEILTGSTRMKAGTAQKMILNMISTTVMIKLGKVYSNLMVDLNATNQKLKKRAKNIFRIITETDKETATTYLNKAEYEVKKAIVMYKKNVNKGKAGKLLQENEGILRQIID